EARRYLAKELDDLLAPQLTGDDDFAGTIYAMHLEHVLGEINADGANLHVDDPSSDSLFNDHPLAHSMPGAGVVHPIIRVDFALSALGPLSGPSRTFSSTFANAGMGLEGLLLRR